MRPIPISQLFLGLGLLFGAGYIVLVPPMQAPDEVAHCLRAYNVSGGSCIAPTATPIPQSLKEFELSFPPSLQAQRHIGFADITRYLQTPLNDQARVTAVNVSANMYNCVPYLPAALGAGAVRLVRLSPGWVLYLERLANLIAYLALTSLAIRQLPGFQIPMLALALMPMTLSQASSASIDGIAFATAFLMCAYFMRLAWDSTIVVLNRRHYVMLAAVVIAASVTKTDSWLTPLVAFVPASKFRGVPRKWLLIAGLIALSLLILAGWNHLNRQNEAVWINYLNSRQIHLSENAALITDRPGLYLVTLARTLRDNSSTYLSEFVGRLGWLVVALPGWLVAIYCLLLGGAALGDGKGIELRRGHRVACVCVAGVAMFAVFFGMWCAEIPVDYRNILLQGIGDIPGVQGRYFIPFSFPLLLAMANRRIRWPRKRLTAMALAVITAANVIALHEVWRTFF